MQIHYGALDFALPGNRIGNIRLAHEIGLEGLELGLRRENGREFVLSQAWFRELYMEEGDKYGIKFPSLAICEFDDYGMTNAFDTEKGRKMKEAIDLGIEIAQAMKMEMIMLPSFNDGYIETEEDFQNTVRALQYACDEAKKYGLWITTENLLPMEENLRLVQQTARSNLSCLYDSRNYKSYMNWDPPQMLRGLIEHDLLYPEIHVKDGFGSNPASCYLGEGDTGFAETMRLLHGCGYSGWLHLENFYDQKPLCDMGQSYIDVAKRDLERLRRFVAGETA